jgi:hypothetical protein
MYTVKSVLNTTSKEQITCMIYTGFTTFHNFAITIGEKNWRHTLKELAEHRLRNTGFNERTIGTKV